MNWVIYRDIYIVFLISDPTRPAAPDERKSGLFIMF